jgi:signal transduction histidine kinase/DNA-binding response OmpR family regulator
MDTVTGTKVSHILILEDDCDQQDLALHAFLKMPEQFRVSLAGTLREARDLMIRETPDLIIADWNLPDGKGLDILPRNDGKVTTPLVIMTSLGNENLAVEIMKSGAIDYVVKSATAFADLPHIARRALRNWENIHRRVLAENAVRDTQKRLADILSFLPDAVLAIDNEGRVIAWNNALERMTGQIEFEKENIGELTQDWAVWDDTYRYMADRNPAYVQSVLDRTSTFESIQVQGVLYYDTAGNYFDGRWYTPGNNSPEEVPANLREYFARHATLLNSSAAGTTSTGFILLPGGSYLVAMHPIMPGSGNGPARGTLVMIRRYGDVEITRLRERVHIPLKLTPLDPGQMKNDPVVLRLMAPGAPDHINIIINASTLGSSTLLPGLDGKPALLLNVTTERSAYLQALATVPLRLVVFVIIAVSFVVIAELLLLRYIVNPLKDLDSALIAIGKKRDLSERLPVSGDDEIASLKVSLNTMLQELEESQIQLAAQRAELAEANRKANLYLDIYLDVLTYEIMNAFFSLSGYADLLKNRVGDDEKEYTLRILDTIKRSDAVIRNIQIISQIYKPPPEQKPVNLMAIVTKVMNEHAGSTLRCRGCDISVLADEKLPIVFQNLISNSIKFGGEAGKIEVAVVDQPEEMVLVSVIDTGRGIPDDMKLNIFDRFMQDSDKRSSYGLGLHIVKMLIGAYGGRIWADDRVSGHPEQGAAIRFTMKKG